MARPRHRVWFARLMVTGLIAVAGLIAVSVWIWQTYLVGAQPLLTETPYAWAPTPDTRPANHTDSGHGDSPDLSMRDSLPSDRDHAGDHPLDPVLDRAMEALAYHRREHIDFTATLVKRERIHRKLPPESRMQLKLRYRPVEATSPSTGNSSVDAVSNPQFATRPFDVYLKFLSPASTAGREVIWRQGENDDQLIVHEAGFLNLTRLHLAPTSGLAMMGNRYPITDIGIEKLLEKLIEKGLRDRELGDCLVRVTDDLEIDGQTCQRIEILHPEPTVTIAGREIAFDFYRAIIDIDTVRNVPLHYASYRWPKPGGEPELEEEYTYLDLKLNCGLSDQDFDPENSDYHYP
jgi:hypothetical protein